MASIELDQVTIEFPIYNARGRSLTVELFRRTVGGLIQSDKSSNVSVVALRDISLVLTDGDRLGLIGHNGAGKTTLLRVLAGIYEPLVGRARINGTVASLTDITMGMDFEATGYENIVLRGVFLGLQAKEMRRMIPEIEAFTELGEFLEFAAAHLFERHAAAAGVRDHDRRRPGDPHHGRADWGGRRGLRSEGDGAPQPDDQQLEHPRDRVARC